SPSLLCLPPCFFLVAALTLSLFFFFHLYAVPRDLHSFPTRRSSDLRPRPCSPGHRGIRQGVAPRLLESSVRRDPRTAAAAHSVRSEEHTSELQSLTNLVCRLLLEKKKHHETERNAEHTTKPSDSTRS